MTKPRDEPVPDQLSIPLSHPDKVFWPAEGYTKLDLARFYGSVFPRLEPYVRDRLLSLERCPDGMSGECFFQKEMPKGMPPGTPAKRIRRQDGGYTNYVVGGLLATQLALVNLGCIAVHVAATCAGHPRQPDWVCFDLDPESGKLADAARAGLRVKDALDALKMVSFPKTSGSRGLHVLVPVQNGPDVGQALSFARSFATRLAALYPEDLTVEARIPARRGRVYVDPFRNGFLQTVVAPYSVRRRPGAPISTPLSWPEVTGGLVPSAFNLGSFGKRLEEPDPWRDFFLSRQSLKDAIAGLKRL
jgi:bifunctional non-homologous end joining protein LigD